MSNKKRFGITEIVLTTRDLKNKGVALIKKRIREYLDQEAKPPVQIKKPLEFDPKLFAATNAVDVKEVIRENDLFAFAKNRH